MWGMWDFWYEAWNKVAGVLGRLGVPGLGQWVAVDRALAVEVAGLAGAEGRELNELVADILQDYVDKKARLAEQQALWDALTKREKEVVALVCLGYLNKEIGAMLDISPATVKAYMRTAGAKLGATWRRDIQRLMIDWDFRGWEEAENPNAEPLVLLAVFDEKEDNCTYGSRGRPRFLTPIFLFF